jgi:DNA-binding transcriptional MerR regulator
LKVKKSLRPIDLARAAGISAQAVRDYERLGFIPAVERGPQGYRQYGPRHMQAIRAARTMIAGFGWEHALHIMQAIHRNDCTTAFALIDARHADIHASRLEVETMLQALHAISSELPSPTSASSKKLLHIGEVARRIAVRVSAIRFWEEQGFIQPTRDKSSGYRLYDEQQVRLLQIVTLLRKTGYNLQATRSVLSQLASGTPQQALHAAQQRLNELSEASRRCTEATATVWEYIHFNASEQERKDGETW